MTNRIFVKKFTKQLQNEKIQFSVEHSQRVTCYHSIYDDGRWKQWKQHIIKPMYIWFDESYIAQHVHFPEKGMIRYYRGDPLTDDNYSVMDFTNISDAITQIKRDYEEALAKRFGA